MVFRYLCSERVLKGDDDSCLREKGDTGKIDARGKDESQKKAKEEL